jgi:hypothetical protein
MNFSAMTTPQLVSFYNRNSPAPVKKFTDRRTAERRCLELFNRVVKQEEATTPEPAKRAAMSASLKLNRTILCVDTGGVWDNAYQLWCERPEWMTSAQVDRLTKQLYSAAKEGRKATVEINERRFELLNIPGEI